MSNLTNIFVETRFMEDISYNSQGGPKFSTNIFVSSSGREQRNINWSQARAEYDVSHGIKTKADMDDILQFFYAMRGRAYGFRYKDWSDFEMFSQQIALGDGVTTIFQIVKTYTDPNNIQTYVRTIKKPVNGSLTALLINGVPLMSGYTIDYTTGLITFSVAPIMSATIVIAYLQFDTPVRFDTDVAAIRFDFYLVESWESIKLVEVRL